MGFPAALVRPSSRLAAWVALWLLATGGGFALLNVYASTPGPDASGPSAWPSESRLALDSDKPTLLLFLHPLCPCSKATLEEFSRLLASHQDDVTARIVFVQPAGLPAERVQGSLWREAARLPGVDLQVDEEGREAGLFGATTSGCAQLFAPSGELLFSGGITISRGHAGDNPGQDSLAALLMGHTPQVRLTPVFGCSLLSDAESDLKESSNE